MGCCSLLLSLRTAATPTAARTSSRLAAMYMLSSVMSSTSTLLLAQQRADFGQIVGTKHRRIQQPAHQQCRRVVEYVADDPLDRQPLISFLGNRSLVEMAAAFLGAGD